MTYDLFDNKAGNYNFSIVGSSGSGKSFFTQDLLVSYRSIGAKVWVIDVGRSYENICQLLDGDFIEFSEESNICINPFSNVKDLAEEMGLLKPLVALMMSPELDLDSWSLSAIEKAIKVMFEKLGNDLTITDLALYLEKSEDSRLVNLGNQLYPWTRGGSHGKFFDGKANVSFNNDFTVLELEELKGKKDLQSIVLMIMLHSITNNMYLLPRDIKKICMIDEAWDIMSGKNTAAADFIETGYRRARKYGGAFGTATQNYGDYFKTPAAEAAFQNADWAFTLRQKEDSIEALVDRNLMSLKDNPYKKKIFSGLKKIDGLYSEVYIEFPEGQGVARLIVDPYSAILFSSKAEHFNKIQVYKQRGLNTSEAVSRTLNDFNIKTPKPMKYNYR